MTKRIRPLVDCVFKAILGDNNNTSQLIHFLNSILTLKNEKRIISVEILNPYNEKEFGDDKLSILDLKATDQSGRYFQVEVQISVPSWLKEKILLNWASIYQTQLQEENAYSKLKPTVSIWLMENTLFPADKDSDKDKYLHLNFKVYEPDLKIPLSDHLNIHVIQFPYFRTDYPITNDKQRWLYFLKEGQNLDIDNLPESLQTEEIIKAMRTLQHFSEDQRAYLNYLTRVDNERYKLSIKETLMENENLIKQQQFQIQQQNSQLQQQNFQLQQQNSQLQLLDAKIQKQEKQIQNFILFLKKAGITIPDDDMKTDFDFI
jgi:predicted transposase/invertase (TIGR01784 family)